MKNSIELKEERGLKIEELANLKKVADSENRNLTEVEDKEVDAILKEVDSLDAKIERSEKVEALEAREVVKSAPVSAKRTPDTLEHQSNNFDIRNVIKGLKSGNFDGLEGEIHQEALKEARECGVSVAGYGIPSSMLEKRTDIDQATSAIQPTVVGAYVDAIREEAVFDKVIPSSNIMNGLSADYKIPILAKQAVAWASAENSAAADGGANFTSVTLSPTRFAGYVDISNRVLTQNGNAVTMSVMADLGRASARLIDAALFSTATVTNAPTSLAATSGVLTFTEAAAYSANVSNYADLLEALQTLANGEGLTGSTAVVANTKLMSDIYKAAQVSSITAATGSSFGTTMNVAGQNTYFTTACTSNGTTSADFIAGDFNKVKLGFFGGLDIVMDPYTSLLNNEIRLVLNRELDFALVQGAAFVKATSLLS
jgi:HK97 family phage major capsid protein